MKKKYLIVLAILALVLAACPTGGGDGTYVPPPDTGSKSDTNPDLTVPATAAEIPALDTGVDYSTDQTEAEELVAGAIDAMGGMLSTNVTGYFASPKAGGARAIQSETFDYRFSEEFQADVEAEIPGAKVYGYAKGTVSYDDQNFVPFKLTADAKFRFELLDGYIFSDYKIKGYYAGSAYAKALTINENSASGTAGTSLDYAVSVAHVSKNKGIKCKIDMDMTLNASKNVVTYKYTGKVFAYDGSEWFKYNEEFSSSMSAFF